MTTAQDVLAVAQGKLGLEEQPRGSNHVPGVTDQYWFWDDTWCDMFVSVCFSEAGLDIKFASCYYSRKAYEDGSIGTWLGKPAIEDLAPGDQVLYGAGGKSHTGLLAAIDVPNRKILTYEGNWGDRSLALWRNYDDGFVFGFGRPNYDGVPAPVVVPTPDAPAPYDPGAHNPYTPLYVDGVFGPKTISALQWSLNGDGGIPDMNGNPLAIDGEWGPLAASSLQRYLNVGIDGDFGPKSTKALQSHVGVKADGQWGPQTTKALQRALNNETF